MLILKGGSVKGVLWVVYSGWLLNVQAKGGTSVEDKDLKLNR